MLFLNYLQGIMGTGRSNHWYQEMVQHWNLKMITTCWKYSSCGVKYHADVSLNDFNNNRSFLKKINIQMNGMWRDYRSGMLLQEHMWFTGVQDKIVQDPKFMCVQVMDYEDTMECIVILNIINKEKQQKKENMIKTKQKWIGTTRCQACDKCLITGVCWNM